MVTTKSGSDTNRVTISNNFAKYYAESAKSYANQAKDSANLAKQTETKMAELLEEQNLSVVIENIESINTVAENLEKIDGLSLEWGKITGNLASQTDLKNTLDTKASVLDIPTKVSELTNDSGYLTTIPAEYITETELSTKGYLTSIPAEYVTETELNAKGYLTQHQDISGKQDCLTAAQLAAIAAVSSKADSESVYTKTEINTKIGNIETLLDTINGEVQ